MNRATISLAVIMLAGTSAYGQEVGFKGVPLGATKEILLEKFPGLRCNKTPEEYVTLGEETCTKRFDGSAEDKAPLESYAGQPATYLTFGIAEGLFGYFSLTIEPRHYDQIKSAVEATLGKGIQTERAIQSRGGLKIDTRTLSIAKPNGTIKISEHAGQIDRGQVMGSSPAFQAYVERVYSEKTKKGSKDI